MSTLIVAFPKIEEARAVRSLLVRKGYDVAVPCTSGAPVSYTHLAAKTAYNSCNTAFISKYWKSRVVQLHKLIILHRN